MKISGEGGGDPFRKNVPATAYQGFSNQTKVAGALFLFQLLS